MLTRLHGIDRDASHRYQSSELSWDYEVIAAGYKYNMADPAASLGIHQLKKVRSFHQRRAAIASHYDRAFASLPLILPPHAQNGDTHSWHLYVIRLRDDVQIGRNRFIRQMAERGICCSVHFKPLHLHSYWRDLYRLKSDDFPHALHAYERSISLPLFSKMSDEDQDLVISAVKELVE